MNYKAYSPLDKEGNPTESRRVRKASRKGKFIFNKALHSARAKKEAKQARQAPVTNSQST